MKQAGISILLLCAAMSGALSAQRRAAAIQFELRHAKADVPELAEVLGLERGMTVADVGAGRGAMTLFMARWLGTSGRV